MERRLKEYLEKMENQSLLWKKDNESVLTFEEKKYQMEDLLIQIGFFQHERQVHLIVTITFAILTMISIMGTLFEPQPALFALIVLLLVLLIPYIRHYYVLENGVQKLYCYYDCLRDSMKIQPPFS